MGTELRMISQGCNRFSGSEGHLLLRQPLYPTWNSSVRPLFRWALLLTAETAPPMAMAAEPEVCPAPVPHHTHRCTSWQARWSHGGQSAEKAAHRGGGQIPLNVASSVGLLYYTGSGKGSSEREDRDGEAEG